MIQCSGQRDGENTQMIVFLDDTFMYEVKPGESICFMVDAGFHSLKFRRGIRSKAISLIADSGYIVRSYFNTLSGLIETSILRVDDTLPSPELKELTEARLVKPVMVSENGAKGFDIVLGEDDPEYEIKCSSGFDNGVLRLYAKRFEFSSDKQLKKEIVQYDNIVSVNKKIGSIDIVCTGNVHKVYSIPKDIYNETIAYLTNRVAELKGV